MSQLKRITHEFPSSSAAASAVSVNLMAMMWMAVGCTTTVKASDDPPNIIVVMADDVGIEWFSSYGGESIETPYLDKLAEQGMRFTQAHATPLCTPSRVKIMTGRYSHRNYVGFGNFPDGELTFANALREGGYATAVTGKWQLRADPDKKGFDEHLLWRANFRNQEGDFPADSPSGARYWYPELVHNYMRRDDVGPTDYGPDLCVDFIIDFIDRHEEQPFLVYYPMILPHFPFEPTPLDIDRDAPMDEKVAPNDLVWHREYFGSMVKYIDVLMGRIADELEERGLSENTLFIFTSDNGTHRPISAQFKGGPYIGEKGFLPDGGTRVPFIAYQPGTVQEGIVTDELVDLTDIFPTVLEMAGVSEPAGHDLDGHSLAGFFQDPTIERREWIMNHMYEHRPGYELGYWVRNQDWKLYNDGRLYYMALDRFEGQTIRPDHDTPQSAEVRARFESVMEKMDREAADRMLEQFIKMQELGIDPVREFDTPPHIQVSTVDETITFGH